MGKKALQYCEEQYRGDGLSIEDHFERCKIERRDPYESMPVQFEDFPYEMQVAISIAHNAPVSFAGMDGAPMDKIITASDAKQEMKWHGLNKEQFAECFFLMRDLKDAMMKGYIEKSRIKKQQQESLDKMKRGLN